MRTLVLASIFLGACNQADPNQPCSAQGITVESRFAHGSRDGHADVPGARAAKQARAGRIRDAAWIRQPADAKTRIAVGDYLIANDKIAAYIEAEGASDSYMPFGGEILAVENVGDDGLPRGLSQYGETILGFSRQAVDPDRVTVLNDGSDGKEAIVRVSGKLRSIPFLETFAGLLPDEFDFPAALDYVLAPGAEKLVIRLHLMNLRKELVDLGTNQNLAFFHRMRSRMFVEREGFGDPAGKYPWLGFVAGEWGFIYRMVGAKMQFLIDVSGFTGFQSTGLSIGACERKSLDYVEVIPGGPEVDGLLAALRRVDGDSSWREVSGKLAATGGATVEGALIHARAEDGSFLTRTRADRDGNFVVHLPPGVAHVTPTQTGYAVPPPMRVEDGALSVNPLLAANGILEVRAKDAGTQAPLPVRVQVIPEENLPAMPGMFGVSVEQRGRLYQEFAHTGTARLVVPPGKHRVIVTRGPEWELHDETVDVPSGGTRTVEAALLHSVDSSGVMCADFHIHSHFSADSSDSVEYKVRGAIADGLELPVSSEHEWIIDFQPVIEQLGLSAWAYGFPSEEFTTFTWGHFGVVPIQPRPGTLNNGAVQWIGKKPPEVFRAIAGLPEKPVLIVNHPSGMSPFGAYFTASHFSRETGIGDPDMWSPEFEAVEVFNDSDLEENRESSLADWFALLDAGKKAWAVGNSDSHSLRSGPVGYPRNCLRFGHDDPQKLSAEAVRDVLRAGNAVVSGGLTMTVEGPGGALPGSTVASSSGSIEVKAVVQTPSWLSAAELEVIVDGQSTQVVQLQESVGAGPGRRYEATVTATGSAGRGAHWVVLHASTPGKDLAPLWPGRKPFAVSNPIFF